MDTDVTIIIIIIIIIINQELNYGVESTHTSHSFYFSAFL
jgi:hypothetical protein